MRVTWRGTADWFGTLNGQPAVLDIKTGSRNAKAHTTQLNLYGGEKLHRIVLYLKPDGYEWNTHVYNEDSRANVVEVCARAWPKYRKAYKHLTHQGKTTFDQKNHVYRVDKMQVPSVSELIQMAGITKPFKPSEYCTEEQYKHLADVGTAVHAWIEWWELSHKGGGVPPHSAEVPAFYREHVVQWDAFKAEVGFVPEDSEVLTGGSLVLPGEVDWQLQSSWGISGRRLSC